LMMKERSTGSQKVPRAGRIGIAAAADSRASRSAGNPCPVSDET